MQKILGDNMEILSGDLVPGICAGLRFLRPNMHTIIHGKFNIQICNIHYVAFIRSFFSDHLRLSMQTMMAPKPVIIKILTFVGIASRDER
jgi:hypothetical protein